jgi:PHD/YefM family antitoxin component YafN of YafNO toxin-antitoxin module
MMIHTIKPSAAIRKNYNEISALCKRTKQPVFLTKNGEGDLVVMDMETYSRRESMLKLRETLMRSEAQRLAGSPGRSVEEVAEMMRQAAKEAADGKRA